MPCGFRRILCPIDFSDTAADVFRAALALAAPCGADVSVVHIHRVNSPAFPLTSGHGSPHAPAPLTDTDRDYLTGQLRDFVAEHNKSGEFVDWTVKESADVPGAIASYAGAINADVIVIGSHGHAGFRRFVLGSVAEHVLRRAHRPVLVVPLTSHSKASGGSATPPRRILCPVDFSPGSRRALESAARVAAHAGATLTIAHIIELPPEMPDLPQADWAAYREARFAHARTVLTDVINALQPACAVHELVLAGNPAGEILRLAAEQQADLIVMGVHGRGAVDLQLFGSMTQHIVRRAECPVLAVPAATLNGADAHTPLQAPSAHRTRIPREVS
jgi:nucleotide-binding universal stress UspA family protein